MPFSKGTQTMQRVNKLCRNFASFSKASIRIRMIRVSKVCQSVASFSKDSIKIRKATNDDYDAVMNIRNSKTLFGGYDNLPDRYNLLLDCPKNKGYVATLDDKVIGFMLAIYVNGSQTVCAYGNRSCERYKNLSITKHISHQILNDREISGSLPSRWAMCLDTKTRMEPFIRSLIANSDFLIKMAILPYVSMTKTVTSILGSSKKVIQSSKQLDAEDMHLMFCSNDLCSNLFPDGRIINLWNPYRPMVENIPLLMDSRTAIIGSNLDKNQLALLSIGTFSHTYRGLLYNLNVFGNVTSCLDEHLFLHVKALSIHATSNITFEITMRYNHRNIPTEDIMRSLGFQRPKTYGNYEMFCYEGNTIDLHL